MIGGATHSIRSVRSMTSHADIDRVTVSRICDCRFHSSVPDRPAPSADRSSDVKHRSRKPSRSCCLEMANARHCKERGLRGRFYARLHQQLLPNLRLAHFSIVRRRNRHPNRNQGRLPKAQAGQSTGESFPVFVVGIASLRSRLVLPSDQDVYGGVRIGPCGGGDAVLDKHAQIHDGANQSGKQGTNDRNCTEQAMKPKRSKLGRPCKRAYKPRPSRVQRRKSVGCGW